MEQIKQHVGSEEELCACLLNNFFAGRFTKHQFGLNLRFFKLFNGFPLPSGFDRCAEIAMNAVGVKKIPFTKRWYCSNKECPETFIELSSSSQRKCQRVLRPLKTCMKKLELLGLKIPSNHFFLFHFTKLDSLCATTWT